MVANTQLSRSLRACSLEGRHKREQGIAAMTIRRSFLLFFGTRETVPGLGSPDIRAELSEKFW